jgi:hypothetical protein
MVGLDEVPDALIQPESPTVATNRRASEWRCEVSEREDRQDIADVLLRYATGIDRRDWPLFRTVFTDDCQLDYGEVGSWKGVDAITEFMQQAHAMAGHTMHRLTNQVITVDGDKAQSRTYVDALIMLGDNNSGVNAAGFYDDDLVRTADGWRVAGRQFIQVRVAPVGAPA